MIRLIFRTDVHVADHSPASWKGDYPAEVWNSLKQIGDLAREHEAAAVLDGGDYFHVKAPTKNSHRLVAKSAWIQSGYPCPTFSIEGNHDIKHNNLETIDEQPLGVLFESGVFRQLRDETFEADGTKVRVVGCPYDATRTLADLRAIQKRDGEHLVAIVHALAGERPPDHVEEFFGEPVFRYEDLVTENGPDIWAFGHWHKDQGIVHIQGKSFVNLGAVSRGALVKENLTRIPKIALLEFGAGGRINVEAIELDVEPASEVFDLEKKERRDQESKNIEQFVDRMKADLEVSRDAPIEDTIGQLGFADEIGALAVEYLRRARGEA